MGGSSNVCLTPQCVTAAADIIQNLHPNYANIDPCDKFDHCKGTPWLFEENLSNIIVPPVVCGGWPQRFPAEENPEALGRLQYANIHVVQTLLGNENPALEGDDKEMFNVLQKNYLSCMDEQAINATDPQGLLSLVSNVTQLFPLGDGGYTSNDTMAGEGDLDAFADATAYLASIGVALFGDFATFQDMKNPVRSSDEQASCTNTDTPQETRVPWYATSSPYNRDFTLPNTPRKTYAEWAADGETILAILTGLLATEEGKEAAPQLAEGVTALVTAMAAAELAFAADFPADIEFAMRVRPFQSIPA